MSNKPVKAKGSGLRKLDGAFVVAVGVVGVIVAFVVLHFVVSFVWEVVKIALIVGVVGGLFWVLTRRRRR
jgi:Flp pilus assembly protein TadB